MYDPRHTSPAHGSRLTAGCRRWRRSPAATGIRGRRRPCRRTVGAASRTAPTTILTWEPRAQRVRAPGRRRPSNSRTYQRSPPSNNSFVSPRTLARTATYWRVTALHRRRARPGRLAAFEHPRWQPRSWCRPPRTRDLAQPDQPAAAAVGPVPGATATRSRSTATATWSAPCRTRPRPRRLSSTAPAQHGDWFWRVTAIKGTRLNSLPSDERGLRRAPLPQPAPPVTRAPDDADPDAAGRRTRLGTRPGGRVLRHPGRPPTTDFTQGGALIETQTGILGTRYSPR